MIPHAAPARKVTDGPSDPIRDWLISPPSRTDLLQYALLYRTLGWNVLPVIGKKIVVRWRRWQQERVPIRVLARLIDRTEVTGLAILCGWISGWPGRKLCVRDFDSVESYLQWADRHPTLAATLPTVRTRRGFHVYCWAPSEINLKFHDGELKASSGTYVVVPPSVHPDGAIYEWVVPFPMSRLELLVLDPQTVGFIPTHTKSTVSLTPVGVTEAVFKSRGESGTEFGEGDSGFAVEDLEGHDSGAGHRGNRAEHGYIQFTGRFGPGVWEAVEASLPAGPGQRNAKVFELARRLKGLPHLADAGAADLEPVVRVWHRRALPVIRTQDWRPTWEDFRTAWANVAFPAGVGPARRLMEHAAAGSPPPEAIMFDDLAVRRLIAVCHALQQAAERCGGDHFFLSCRTAAAVCGFGTPMTACRWLNRLVDRGVLELVRRGTVGVVNRRASRYRFIRDGRDDRRDRRQRGDV
jgi:hypothetical protein